MRCLATIATAAAEQLQLYGLEYSIVSKVQASPISNLSLSYGGSHYSILVILRRQDPRLVAMHSRSF
jgi:hypothetical protein